MCDRRAYEKGLCHVHDPVAKERNRRNNAKRDKVMHNAYMIEFRRALRIEAFNAYGGAKCACCGETEFTFLQLDHMNDDGAEHRKRLMPSRKHGLSSTVVFADLKRHGWPSGYQVLCANCNIDRELNNGTCPHKR